MAERLEVTAVYRGGLAADVTARDHTVRIDEPETVTDGTDSGMMPTELFIASVASCFCLAVAWAARKRDIEVPGLTVRVQSERAGTELRYGRIDVHTEAEVDDDTLAALVRSARALCWVSNTLANGTELRYGHTSLDARFRK